MPCAGLPTTLRCMVGSTVCHFYSPIVPQAQGNLRQNESPASDFSYLSIWYTGLHGSSLIFLPSDLASWRLSRSTKVTAIYHPNCDSFNTERKNCFVINKYIKTTYITRNDTSNLHVAPTLSKLSGPQNPSQIPGYHWVFMILFSVSVICFGKSKHIPTP